MTNKALASALCISSLAIICTLVLPSTIQAEEPKPETLENKPTDQTSETEFKQYIVQKGDYLSAIAKEHQISWPSIYEVNTSISNPDIIHPSQDLRIPSQDVPLTRLVPQETTLAIPETYQPQPMANNKPTTVAPKPVAAPSYSTAVVGGVPGLNAVLGRPYVAGGSSPATGFDCSGLTQYLAAQKGVAIPRTASGQYNALRKVSLAEAWAGDVIVFNLGHVGTYLGGGQVVHALNPAQGIRIENIQTAIKYNGFLSAVAIGH